MKKNNTEIWREWLADLVMMGEEHYPRGFKCFAIYNKQLVFDPMRPLIIDSLRKLSFKFAFAEAYWILSGDDTVKGITPYNKNIAQFSDDGYDFFGAYGPKIVDQLPYVIRNLDADPHSRQAVITIWRESPPKSKDIPCTVMVQFRLSPDGKELHSHVVMRSSDVWLGLPYDVFNFSMLMHVVALSLKQYAKPTTLTYTLMNGHLYERNVEAAQELLAANYYPGSAVQDIDQPECKFDSVQHLMRVLEESRDAEIPIKRWSFSHV